ncbi:hypothetical protein LTR09_000669 [Extremus antarcticus]|uniref:Fe2OG dioxygenase domain-containing protein n=1 Tax=Extremus antarcticus TaxID=702011 RepID=A0AAJ0GK72_9PEZI|nr:hypothetical protein LTR09_000669 [Extremus antarcticus]
MAGATASNAVLSDNLTIPLIDFSAFIYGDKATTLSTAQAILRGFQDAGFIYLKNHPIDSSTIQRTFDLSAKFFSRLLEEKDALSWTTPEANRGYSGQGREKTSNAFDSNDIAKEREQAGDDLKESFEIGLEGVDGMPNHWPDQADRDGKVFKEHMLDFFGQLHELHMQIMRAMAVGLGIERTWFDSYCDEGDNTLRLLHYPEVKAEVFKQNKNQVRAGAHSDYGSITLLFQDMRGGLQVLSPNGNFIDATPIVDTIVVNAGDLLSRWSNDTIKSTKHRVMEPPTPADTHPARYSIAYFCNPNFESLIDAIPSTYDGVEGKKYEAVKSGEYIVQRLSATY